MSEEIYLITLGLPLATLLIIFGMKYFASIRQARSRALAEDAYRTLAEKAILSEEQGARSLSAIRAELSEISARLAAVEKMLKTVE